MIYSHFLTLENRKKFLFYLSSWVPYIKQLCFHNCISAFVCPILSFLKVFLCTFYIAQTTFLQIFYPNVLIYSEKKIQKWNKPTAKLGNDYIKNVLVLNRNLKNLSFLALIVIFKNNTSDLKHQKTIKSFHVISNLECVI